MKGGLLNPKSMKTQHSVFRDIYLVLQTHLPRESRGSGEDVIIMDTACQFVSSFFFFNLFHPECEENTGFTFQRKTKPTDMQAVDT